MVGGGVWEDLGCSLILVVMIMSLWKDKRFVLKNLLRNNLIIGMKIIVILMTIAEHLLEGYFVNLRFLIIDLLVMNTSMKLLIRQNWKKVLTSVVLDSLMNSQKVGILIILVLNNISMVVKNIMDGHLLTENGGKPGEIQSKTLKEELNSLKEPALTLL
jgi:hypothetical protein